MRDVQKLTFGAIAQKLNDKGLVSQRGKKLSEELVFSMYKKDRLDKQSVGSRIC